MSVNQFASIFNKRAPVIYLWLHTVISRFISGFATAFLVVSAGSTTAKSMGDFPTMSMRALVTTCLVGGIVETFRFLKDNALPKFSFEPPPPPEDKPPTVIIQK